MSALRRALVQLLLDVPGAVLNVDAVMNPVRAAFRHWKRVEPYEFRIPVPEKVVEALCGVFLEMGDFAMLHFLRTTFHHWLRPGEALALVWGDIASTWEEVQTYGICRIGNPKI